MIPTVGECVEERVRSGGVSVLQLAILLIGNKRKAARIVDVSRPYLYTLLSKPPRLWPRQYLYRLAQASGIPVSVLEKDE